MHYNGICFGLECFFWDACEMLVGCDYIPALLFNKQMWTTKITMGCTGTLMEYNITNDDIAN